jgi:hypothetical protein
MALTVEMSEYWFPWSLASTERPNTFP